MEEHLLYSDLLGFTQLWINIVCNFDVQGTACFFFYISHYSAAEINPFHDGSVAENTTEQVNWYF